jgi:hypothetical protein
LQIFYFDAELAGINKNELNFYSNNNKGDWLFTGKDNYDTSNNWVLKNNIRELAAFTLAGNIKMPLP